MSKKNAFKSQASSSRVAGASSGFGGFGTVASNTLSYLSEPANLSTITDPNVVVSFKTLSKKDATTKTKGLEDLRAYIEAHPYSEGGGVEDSILEAWVNLYPRLSIDNSRRVRELSHLILCDLLKSARKRMEKHIPKIAGAWLAGLYDKDRAAAKAATTTLTSFLDTDIKVAFLKKQCQGAILGYIQDAINETPETLSDERTMSEDDRQDKYNRVISSSLYLIVSLLSSLGQEDISKHQDKYEELLLNNQLVWSLAASKDANVRKAISDLVIACVEHQPGIMEESLEVIGKNLIVKGLHTSQSTTASSLLLALVQLSIKFPVVWAPTATPAKKNLSVIFRSFISKGPQGCNEQYWNALLELFKVLPDGLLGVDIENSELTLQALELGINNKNTMSSHLGTAWACYAETARLLVSRLSQTLSPIKLCESTIYPLFGKWLGNTMGGQSAIMLKSLAQLYNTCASLNGGAADKSFAGEWQRLGQELITSIQTSLPEQSQGYKESQDSVTARGLRWYQFASAITHSDKAKSAEYIMLPSRKILLSALSISKSRNGKPYSAAAIAEAGLRLIPDFGQSPEVQSETEELLLDSFSQLITSPSSKYIISIFQHMGESRKNSDLYRELWEEAVDGILAVPDITTKTKGLLALMSPVEEIPKRRGLEYSDVATFVKIISQAARKHAPLQEYFLEQAGAVMKGSKEALPLLQQALLFDAMDIALEARLVEQATTYLFTPYFPQAFQILDLLFRSKPSSLKSEEIQTLLVVKLLSLTEQPHRGDPREGALRNMVDVLAGESDGDKIRQKAVVQAIRFGLHGQIGMSTETLIRHARGLLSKPTDPKIYEDLLPDLMLWAKELVPLLLQAPNPSLGLMRPFAGAAFLAKESETDVSKELLYLLNPLQKAPTSADQQLESIARDKEGLSRPLRMAMYTVGLFSDTAFLTKLSLEQQETIIRLSAMTRELVNDQLDLIEENKLYATNKNHQALEVVQKYVADYKLFLNGLVSQARDWNWRNGHKEATQGLSNHDTSETIRALVGHLLQATSNKKPRIYAYYSSRVFGRVLEALCGMQAWKSDSGEEWLSTLGVFKTTVTDSLAAQSILVGIDSGLLESKVINTFCNRLVSDLADAKPTAANTLEKIILLNSCLEIYADVIPVAKNRLMFAIKNMISWTPTLASRDKQLASEVCRALQLLLPATGDMFGSHWETTLQFCVSIWGSNTDGSLSDESIPMIGMSLKLYSVLQKMEEPNDDFQEALEEHREEITHGLLSILKLQRKKSTVPLRYIDELLSRILKNLPPRPISELADLYPLVASDFPLVQSAAYIILDSSLSAAQQQISVDVLLEKTDAQFPDELLSLLLEVPSVHDFTETEIDEFPPAFRRYLFSWHLIFQSFATASNKVRNDYTEVLKSGDYIGPFLLFMADVLGHSVGNALDLGVAEIDSTMRRQYIIESASDTEGSEKNMHWLLSNLYCLALIYTPMLVKSWWTDCNSRPTKIAFEQWTEKFFTQIVVAEHLEEVQKWADGQESTDDEKELIVKTSTRSRDIFVGYEIDDMTMQMNIQLPANYPLQPVVVSSINRVGIPENKWKSFMITTQAVISFSNGSITEGLATFRRNIISALKGHTECAICYSIISSDKKTPDKRCSTCNNLFHSKCLYTWFVSSSQSTCPLCRNPFNYSSGAR